MHDASDSISNIAKTEAFDFVTLILLHLQEFLYMQSQ